MSQFEVPSVSDLRGVLTQYTIQEAMATTSEEDVNSVAKAITAEYLAMSGSDILQEAKHEGFI